MASHNWDVVVVGGANTDYLVRGPALPKPGETVAGETFQEAPGGKGANQAVAAARLGAREAFIGRVGQDDRGDLILERLATEGVDVRYVSRDAEAASGVALVMVEDSGEKQILTAPGANLQLSATDVNAAAAYLSIAKVVLIPVEFAESVVMTAARAAGAKVVLDPARPEKLPDELFRLVEVIKPNASEATAITGIEVKDRASARRAADWLLERGVQVVAVQAGDEGDLLVWSEGERWLPRFPVHSIDATGAGDAFAAALAVALAEGRSWEEAGPFASAAAALTTTKIGAMAALPHRQDVEALLADQERIRRM